MNGKEIKNILTDSATVVGCCVGVGFLSGKEAQSFFGNVPNVLVFALCFFALTTVVREFCRRQACFDIATLSRRCFGLFAPLFTVLFLLCCFVCLVTMLAGIESCLQIVWKSNLPIFAVISAVISAVVLKKGLKALKILNVLSVILALAYITIFAFVAESSATLTTVSPLQPIKYTLFSVTMSLGVLAPLSNTTGKTNVLATAIATFVLCALVVFVLHIANFSSNMPLFGNNFALNIFGGIAMTLATVTGIVANTLPIVQCLHDVFEDDSLCISCVFCLAVAFSMFGFDFALRYGYIFVAIVGMLLSVAIIAKLLPKKHNMQHRPYKNVSSL